MATSAELKSSLANNPSNMATPGMNALQLGPQTGIPLLDAIFSNSAQTVASLTGIGQVRYIPVPGSGMNMREAMIARDITTPLYRTMQDQAAYSYGSAFGQSLASVGVMTGVNRMMNMSPDAFTRELVNAGSSPMGRAAMEFMMQQPAMQQALGGNPMAAAESVFSQRRMLGTAPGQMLSPMDITGQWAAAQHASEMQQSLMAAAYSGPNGMSAALNPMVTRGFNFEEFAYMGLRGAQAGMPGMRGMGVSGDQFAGGTMAVTEMMAALRGNVGTSDPIKLFNHLERIAGPDWGKSDVRGLTAAFHQTKALSSLLGGDVFETASGFAETFRGTGYELGVTGATTLAGRAHAIQNVTGGNLANIAGRVGGMAISGLNSQQGGDAMSMEWVRQNIIGDPSKPDNKHAGAIYSNWQNAVAHGNKAEQAQWANKMYSTYGRGMDTIMADPTMRREAWDNMLDKQSRDNVIRSIGVGQNREFIQRTQESLAGTAEGVLADLRGATGRGYQDTSATYETSVMDQLRGRAKAYPNDMLGIVSSAEKMLGSITDPGARRAALDGLMNSDPRLKPQADEIRRNANMASRDEEFKRLSSPEALADAQTTGQMEILRGRGYDRAVNDAISSDMKSGGLKAQAALAASMRAGSTDIAQAFDAQDKSVKENIEAQRGTYAATREAERIQTAAHSVNTKGAMRDLSDLLSGKTTYDTRTAGLVDSNPVLNDAQKQRFTEALKSGDGAKMRAAKSELDRISVAIQGAEVVAGGGTGQGVRGSQEAMGAAGTAAVADLMGRKLSRDDALINDVGLPGSQTGLAGLVSGIDAGKGGFKSALQGLGMEAIPGTRGAKGAPAGATGGVATPGAMQITGTLDLITGQVSGTVMNVGS